MGYHNLHRVMNALDGVEIFVPSKNDKGEDVKKNILQAPQMMLLLAVAHRQPDKEQIKKNFPESDLICYGDRETMKRLAHIAIPTLGRVRNELVNAGLLFYEEKPEEEETTEDGRKLRKPKKYRDFNHPDDPPRIFTNVYQLMWPKIFSYRGVSERDAGVSERDAGGSERAAGVSERAAGVSERDTKKNKEITKKDILINSSSKKSPDASSTAAAIEKLGRLYWRHIVVAAALKPYESQTLDPYPIGLNATGKNTQDVLQYIDEFITKREAMRSTDFDKWVRILVIGLKTIPKSDTHQTEDEIFRAFGERRRAYLADLRNRPNLNETERTKLSQMFWLDFGSNMGLDDLDKQRRSKLFEQFGRLVWKYQSNLSSTLDKFESKVLRNYKGDPTTTHADVRESSPDERYDLVNRTLMEFPGMC